LSIVKTKLKGHVQVVQEDNDELNAIDDVFQIDKLVDAYQVAMSTDLEENSNFYGWEYFYWYWCWVKWCFECTSINSIKRIMIDMKMIKLKKKKIFLLNCKMSMCNEIDFNVITYGIT